MRLTPETRLIEFQPELADELVATWRAGFERGVGITDPHPVEDQRRYLLEQVLPQHDVRVALSADGTLVGFVAASTESVAPLYVHVDFQARGIGTASLEWAKEQSSGTLWLSTFESNQGAQRFYERNGFEPVARGFEEDWQLKDLRYEWVRPAPS